MAIDYVKAQALYTKHKGILTRAEKKGYAAVLAACTQFVRDFEAIHAPWPDNWSRWQRSLDDAAHKHNVASAGHGYVPLVRLESL